jgi:hypothetical protein
MKTNLKPLQPNLVKGFLLIGAMVIYLVTSPPDQTAVSQLPPVATAAIPPDPAASPASIVTEKTTPIPDLDRIPDVLRSQLSEAEKRKIQNWAINDARKAWSSLNTLPDKDGKFDVDELATRAAEVAERMAAHHGILDRGKDNNNEVYDLYVEAYFATIIHVADPDNETWKHL